MEKNKIFIHIGVPKSGTTSLQTHLFYKHKDLISIGKIKPYTYKSLYPNQNLHFFFSTLKKSEEITFPHNKMNEIYTKEIAQYRNKKLIISDEGFTNSIFSDTYLKAKRLKKFFPYAKIIYVIRNQFDVIKSIYYMLPKSPLFLTEEKKILSLNKWLDISFNNLNNSFLLTGKYFEVYQIYSELFGESNISLLLYEDFKHNPKNFIEKLSDFMNIDKKESFKLLNDKEKINSKEFHKSNFISNNYPFWKYLKCNNLYDRILTDVLSKENEEKIIDLYKESNNKLNRILKNELLKNNYPV